MRAKFLYVIIKLRVFDFAKSSFLWCSEIGLKWEATCVSEINLFIWLNMSQMHFVLQETDVLI